MECYQAQLIEFTCLCVAIAVMALSIKSSRAATNEKEYWDKWNARSWPQRGVSTIFMVCKLLRGSGWAIVGTVAVAGFPVIASICSEAVVILDRILDFIDKKILTRYFPPNIRPTS